MDSRCKQRAGNAYKLRIFRLSWLSRFLSIGLGCQKVDFNLVAGKLHKAETVFVTLGEN